METVLKPVLEDVEIAVDGPALPPAVDNQLALNAGWDSDLLRLELVAPQDDNFDLGLIGFEDEELARLLAAQDAAEGLTDEDAVPDLPARPTSLVVILLEWTIQDSKGHTIWLQTAQGSSQHKAGWLITTEGVGAMVDAAVADLAKASIAKISAAPELQRLSQ